MDLVNRRNSSPSSNQRVPEQAIPGSQASFQSVFRAVQQWPNPTSTSANPQASEYDNEPIFHTRRPHKKSRGGCKNCKRRRIKCDESRPQCQRCKDHRISCNYVAPVPTAPVRIGKGEPAPASTMYSMSLAVAASSLDALLQPEPDTPAAHLLSTHKITPYLQTLQHFETVTYATVGSPIAQHVVRSSVLKIAMEYPYLMHATLAVSATHLKHLLPDATHREQYRQNSFSESYHWQRALSLFREELSSPRGIGAHNMDPLLSTSMLFAILSFSLDDFNPRNSFVFNDNPSALNWLSIQSGLKGLLIELQTHIPGSVWMPVFIDSDDKRGSLDDQRDRIEGLPSAFVDLCDLTPESRVENNPYHAPVRLLSPLLQLDASIATFGKLITFMGRISPPFLSLLRARDPRALLILSYWFALMCNVKQWWILGRVQSECIAICIYLRDSPLCTDPRIQTLLGFPARVCGVDLGREWNDSRSDEDVFSGFQTGGGGLEMQGMVERWPPACADEMRSSGIDEIAGPRIHCPTFRRRLLGRDAE